MEKSESVCPLCAHPGTEPYFEEIKNPARPFFLCPNCGLVFVPASRHVSPEDEKRRYDLHRNDASDRGYRSFLTRLVLPLCARLPEGAAGLDFGSGPGPVLSGLMTEMGHPMEIYDPFYAPDPAPLDRQHDFVTATEVVEHLRRPQETLERIWSLVRPGGWLGLLTQIRPLDAAFGRWTYKNDPTHVLFFSVPTFEWLADRWNAELVLPQDNVVLLGKAI